MGEQLDHQAERWSRSEPNRSERLASVAGMVAEEQTAAAESFVVEEQTVAAAEERTVG